MLLATSSLCCTVAPATLEIDPAVFTILDKRRYYSSESTDSAGRTQCRIVDEIDDDTLEAAADLTAPDPDASVDEVRRELVRWAVLSALDDLIALGVSDADVTIEARCSVPV